MPSSTAPAQQGGPGAVRRWIALLDAAETAIYQVDPADPVAQRTAGRRIESLFLFEHQMTPEARRLAREAVWRRDHPGKSLARPTASADCDASRTWLCLRDLQDALGALQLSRLSLGAHSRALCITYAVT